MNEKFGNIFGQPVPSTVETSFNTYKDNVGFVNTALPDIVELNRRARALSLKAVVSNFSHNNLGDLQSLIS